MKKTELIVVTNDNMKTVMLIAYDNGVQVTNTKRWNKRHMIIEVVGDIISMFRFKREAKDLYLKAYA
ncbi:MAG: hypothetical protein J6I76_00085 [Oribacterium sp.]|nr:hypothetical protein [Oribacterium sp.]